ncbi:MAG TPA: LacI family DNA-binding transcriptional regulator [Trebonia sp.]
MTSKPPTIADVAKAADVSVPTVSRVMTGNIPVGPKRRARVEKAIQDLGYRPNAAARALVSGRHSMIAIIAANTSRYGYARTVEGVEEAARAAGYMVVITVVETAEAEHVNTAVDMVLSQSVAGVVVLDFDQPGHAVAAALPSNIPAVVAAASASRSTALPRAYLADQRGARQATEYLLSLGHKNVHHIALPSSGRRGGRAAGWAAALKAAGIVPPAMLSASWNPIEAYELARTLAADPAVTAVLAGNDEVALGVLRAMTEHGRGVPGDVSVIGFDDQPIASLVSPALTTVAQDFAELGRQSFALLQRSITRSAGRGTVSVPARLVIRQSTAKPAAAGSSRSGIEVGTAAERFQVLTSGRSASRAARNPSEASLPSSSVVPSPTT